MKNSKIGNSVAAEMSGILASKDFQSIFSASVPQIELSVQEKAFRRIASKKCEKCDCPCDECKCEKCDCSPADDKEEDEKKEKEAALQYIIDTLAKTSEVLDNLGLSKSASKAIKLAHDVFEELEEEDDEDDEDTPEVTFGDSPAHPEDDPTPYDEQDPDAEVPLDPGPNNWGKNMSKEDAEAIRKAIDSNEETNSEPDVDTVDPDTISTEDAAQDFISQNWFDEDDAPDFIEDSIDERTRLRNTHPDIREIMGITDDMLSVSDGSIVEAFAKLDKWSKSG